MGAGDSVALMPSSARHESGDSYHAGFFENGFSSRVMNKIEWYGSYSKADAMTESRAAYS
jgi:hypothetical protein